jgi:hypothetical protein
MAKAHRLVGLSGGTVDTVRHEMSFNVTASDGQSIVFVAEFGPASQLISGLSRMLSELRHVLYEAQGMKSIAAEAVAASHVQMDQWENVVLMQLITPQGVPYTFALKPQEAAEIADQLKTESAKPHQSGSA